MEKTNGSCKWGGDFALNTGTNIPAIGFGTWKLPKETAKETIITAFHAGYRHFDCALAYENQKEIGTAFQDLINGRVNRGDIFVTSKLWNTSHRRHQAHEELRKTLKELRLHHLDLYLMHWPLAFTHGYSSIPRDINGHVLEEDVSIEETWAAMEEMYKDGKCRAIGVSNFTLPMLQQLEQKAEIMPAVLQIEHHPYLLQSDLVRYCLSHGIHVTAYSPLGAPDIEKSNQPKLLDDPVLREIALKYDKTPGQIALIWNVQQHISVIPKSTSEAHMRENMQIFDIQLSDSDMKALNALNRDVRYVSSKESFGIPLFDDEKEEKEASLEDGVCDMYKRWDMEAR